jgi:hypothetical protein
MGHADAGREYVCGTDGVDVSPDGTPIVIHSRDDQDQPEVVG